MIPTLTGAALTLLQLNLWALLVWLIAAGAARRFEALAAWPGYWLGAVVLAVAPPIAAWLAPMALVSSLTAFLSSSAVSAASELTVASLRGFVTWFAGQAFSMELLAAAPAASEPATFVAANAAASVTTGVAADAMSLAVLAAPATDAAGPSIVMSAQTSPAMSSAASRIMSEALPPLASASAPFDAAPLMSFAQQAMMAIAAAYLLIGAAFAARCLAAHARILMLARTGVRLDSVRAPWPVYLVSSDTPPCALGFPARRILIPAALQRRVDDAELAMILRHEAAHIGRRDPEVTLALGLVCALFWPNPAMRGLVARWTLAAEIAADAAVAQGQAPALRTRYARLLISALRGGSPGLLAAPSAALRLDGVGGVKLRLSAILHAPHARGGGAARFAAGVSGVALLCAGALGCAAFAQTAPSLAPIDAPTRLAPLADPQTEGQSQPQSQPQPSSRAQAAQATAQSQARVVYAQSTFPAPAAEPFEVPPAPAYPAAPPLHAGMSAAEREEAMADWQAELENWEIERAKWQAEWEAGRAEWQAERDAERAERDAERAERQAEREEARAERERELAEVRAEREQALAEARAERQMSAGDRDWDAWGDAWSEDWSQSWDGFDPGAIADTVTAAMEAASEGQRWAQYGAAQGRIWGQYGARMGQIQGRVGRLMGQVGAMEGRLAMLSSRRNVSEAELAEALADLEEARAELELAQAERERDLAELEADLEQMLAELPEPDTYDYDYDYDYDFDFDFDFDVGDRGDRGDRAADRPADPDAAAVSRILEGGPEE